MIYTLCHIFLALIAAPFMLAVINRTKAFFGGRHGPSFFQPYYDLAKLLRKEAVYSRTTTWVFRAGPGIGLGAVLTALLVTPLGGTGALLAFPGDILFWAYCLGVMRFFTVLAALDTGSAFEGMGASREVQFAVLAEVALLLGLAGLAYHFGEYSLSTLCRQAWGTESILKGESTLLLVSVAILIVLLTENARIPIDDPTTHLELTMVHEVMILDHCGVDLALIEYAAAIKFWIFGALLVSLALPMRSVYPACGPGTRNQRVGGVGCCRGGD